jgi:uncharacterized membrane protein
MWGPWAGPMWGFWWIFPLMGFLLCLAFAVMVFRFIATGRGFVCIGGHQRSEENESTALRREIQALREEIAELKASR